MGSAARHVLHEALLWGAIALGGAALIYFFDDIRAALGPGGSAPVIAGRSETKPPVKSGFAGEVRLKADARGHFLFPAEVNGRPAHFMADTGATLVVLTYENAARLGLSPHSLDFSGLAETANGTARVAPVTLDRVRIEDITLHGVPAVVAEKGALATNLLGMSFLGRLRSFQIRGGELILVQ
ncbi:MAG TPA: TIGR02281 family clan AA aspartic protease [Methyloceanibacter sp.]|nr:TIGR02281 family clan AA aspartic protease [Methyloceanibacter sp.]